MTYPITLTVSPGRSGTRFLCSTFHENYGDRAAVSHEILHPNTSKPAVFHRCYDRERQADMLSQPEVKVFLSEWTAKAERGPVVDFGFTMSSLIPGLFEERREQVKALMIHRHPVEVAASFAVRGHYTINKSPNWAITPMHEGARYKAFRERWATMSPFERCLYRWLEITAYGLELKTMYPDLPLMTVRSVDLFSSDDVLREIAVFCGFGADASPERARDKNPVQIHHVERQPIRDEWRRYARHPELIELGQSLGYDMSEAHVGEIVQKYRLPPGLGPRLRHYSGYWGLRFIAGKWLRQLGLKKDDTSEDAPGHG